MNKLVPIAATHTVPALVAATGDRAGVRFLEFFAANIRYPHTGAPTRGRWASFSLGVKACPSVNPDQLGSSETTAKKQRQDRIIPPFPNRTTTGDG
jgi:hypothetical protein